LYSSLATRVEPVKVTFFTTSLSHISFETSLRFFSVVTTFMTPSGTPALRPSWIIRTEISYVCLHRKRGPTSARASAENGVSAGGLITAVQPAAKAAPSFRVIIADGKFQGVRIDLYSGYEIRQRNYSDCQRTRRLDILLVSNSRCNRGLSPMGCLMTTLRMLVKGEGTCSDDDGS